MTEHTVKITNYRILSDGTKKYYQTTRTYKINGHVFDDGTVFKLSPEQVAGIKSDYERGIKIKRLEVDYDCSYTTIKKALAMK